MNHAVRVSLVGAAILLAPAVASAGFLDKLNEATKKMNESSQQMQQGSQQQAPPAQGGQATYGGGSLSAGLGATNLHGLTDYNGCMAQSSGSMEKLTVQVLQRKLNQSKTLSPQERRNIEADVAWLTATAAGQKLPSPDPKNPQRYLLELTDQEQEEITGANNPYLNAVHEKCEEFYGGMTQFSDASGRRPAHKGTAIVPFPTLAAVAPAAVPSAMDAHRDCMAGATGLRWKAMADRMETRMAASGNLSAADRKAWEEDIAAVRAAQQAGSTGMPQSPDPKNLMRYMLRLTPEDQMAVNQDFAAARQALMATGSGGGSAGGATAAASQDARHRELEAMHNARRQPKQPVNTAAASAEAQAWLDAHPMVQVHKTTSHGTTTADYLEQGGVMACFDRQKGFRAKQTADRLTTKRGTVPTDQRNDLEAWITAWRAAEQAKLDEPTPPNGAAAQGYYTFLTNTDQQELNMANSAVHNQVMSECNSIDHMEIGAKNSKVTYGGN